MFLFGPIGAVTAWITVLQFASIVSSFILNTFVLPRVSRIVFDTVLQKEEKEDLILEAKCLEKTKIPLHIRIRRSALVVPNYLLILLPKCIMLKILLLLVSLIPVVGPMIVIFIRAPYKGLSSHGRYFDLKGWDRRKIRRFFNDHRADYAGYGVMALFLEMAPYVIIFFIFTNAIGIALWTVDIERKQGEADRELPEHDCSEVAK